MPHDLNAAPVRILLVEDAGEVRSHIAQALAAATPAGYQLTRAGYYEALALLPDSAFDVLVLNLSLCEVDDLECYNTLRQAAQALPIVVVSDDSDAELAVSAVRAGAHDYLLHSQLTGDLVILALRCAIERHAYRQTIAEAARRQALTEEALRRSEQRYRRLFEDSINAIYISERDGSIVDMNEAALELFGYSREEMYTLVADALYARPEDRTLFRQKIEEAGAVRDYEVKLRRKDGEELQCQVTASVRRSPDGTVIGYQGVIRDVTEYRRLQRQLLHSQKMESMGRLAAGIAHDFNNLLTTILGHTELLAFDLAENDRMQEDLTEIREAAQRAASLSRQLLAFSRPRILQSKLVDLGAMLGDMERMLRRVVGDDIELTTRIGSDLQPVRADPAQLEQVVMNLVVNSRDAMPSGGRLTLALAMARPQEIVAEAEAKPPTSYIALTVSDTGVGMEEEIVTNIFDPFFTTKGDEGTGLGLSTAYAIVKASGGFITVDSQPGVGTSFRVYLPAAKGVEAPSVEEQPPVEVSGGTETVLVVEDEPAVRNVLRSVLERSGYTVVEAGSPSDALAQSKGRGREIDLAVIDVSLPGMNGVELSRQISEIRPTLKVLFISGSDPDSLLDRAALDPTRFLEKPFTAEALARRVREAIDR